MPLTPEEIAKVRSEAGASPIEEVTAPVKSLSERLGLSAIVSANDKKKADIASVKGDEATFPADPNQEIKGFGDAAKIAVKTVGNIPESGWNFAKGTLKMINPVSIVKNAIEAGKQMKLAGEEGVPIEEIIKAVPIETYKSLVPQFLQHIFSGDFGKASATVQNDPVGQILPLILIAKQGAEAMGKGEAFDSAMTQLASPATKAGEALKNAAGQVASQTLGAGTGTGASSVSETFKAGKAGGDSAEAFTKAMRGEISPEEVVKSAHDIVGNIKQNRGNAYVEQLKTIGEDKTTHDIAPVFEEFNSQLKKFGIKGAEIDPATGKVTGDTLDFSRSSIANNGTARADIQGVFDTIKDWGTQSGDRSGVGLDLLKKQLGDFYSQSSQARAFVQGVKGKVTNLLDTNVKGYKDMTANYSKVSDFVDEIKSATGAGSNAKPDTVFTKLTTAMKGDKEFRLEVMDEMTKTDPTFMAKVAGTNMASWIPKGLVGRGIDVSAGLGALAHVFNPSIIPALIGTSPRIVGEFVRAMGMTAGQVEPILKAINTFKIPEGTGDKMGLSVKNIAKGITPESVAKNFDSFDIKLVQSYLDNPQDPKAYMKIQPILEGAKLAEADPKLVDRFLSEVLDIANSKNNQ